MLASSPFLLAPGRPCPRSMHPRSMCVHAKAKTRNKQTSNRRKRCKEHMKRQTSNKANKRWCSQGTNVGLDQVSITSLHWSMDDTLASKTHAWTCKQACKMHIKPTGGTNNHGKHVIPRSGKGERCARSNWHHVDASQMITSKQGFMGVGCNHTTTNPLRALSVAKPRTREASMEDKA